mgnify:CR=1 FL=1
MHTFLLMLGLSPPPCWQVLVPALLDLETQLFGEMLRILWWGVLLPTGGSVPGGCTSPGPGVLQGWLKQARQCGGFLMH